MAIDGGENYAVGIFTQEQREEIKQKIKDKYTLGNPWLYPNQIIMSPSTYKAFVEDPLLNSTYSTESNRDQKPLTLDDLKEVYDEIKPNKNKRAYIPNYGRPLTTQVKEEPDIINKAVAKSCDRFIGQPDPKLYCPNCDKKIHPDNIYANDYDWKDGEKYNGPHYHGKCLDCNIYFCEEEGILSAPEELSPQKPTLSDKILELTNKGIDIRIWKRDNKTEIHLRTPMKDHNAFNCIKSFTDFELEHHYNKEQLLLTVISEAQAEIEKSESIEEKKCNYPFDYRIEESSSEYINFTIEEITPWVNIKAKAIVKPQEEDHTGQTYNPYSGKWSFL